MKKEMDEEESKIRFREISEKHSAEASEDFEKEEYQTNPDKFKSMSKSELKKYLEQY